jgi:pimeloyl-ACP methyl ester carboxylesterase
VFAYDRRGRGDSGDTLPYDVQREVDDLAAVIDAAGGEAFVFGHSSGAALALEAAVRGLAIAKLGLYEPPYIVDDSRPPVPADYLAHMRELIALERPGEAVEYFMTAAVLMPADLVAQMRDAPTWPAMEAMAPTLPYDAAVMEGLMGGRPLPASWASSVTMPVLALDGGNSPAWARNSVRELAKLLPDVEHRTLEGQDHGAAPDALAPVLTGFFLR